MGNPIKDIFDHIENEEMGESNVDFYGNEGSKINQVKTVNVRIRRQGTREFIKRTNTMGSNRSKK